MKKILTAIETIWKDEFYFAFSVINLMIFIATILFLIEHS
jgi:hypothetical protein